MERAVAQKASEKIVELLKANEGSAAEDLELFSWLLEAVTVRTGTLDSLARAGKAAAVAVAVAVAATTDVLALVTTLAEEEVEEVEEELSAERMSD